MKFVGSTIIYSYLQAIGVINSHDEGAFARWRIIKRAENSLLAFYAYFYSSPMEQPLQPSEKALFLGGSAFGSADVSAAVSAVSALTAGVSCAGVGSGFGASVIGALAAWAGWAGWTGFGAEWVLA